MAAFEDIKPGSRIRGLDASVVAEIVPVSRSGPDALILDIAATGVAKGTGIVTALVFVLAILVLPNSQQIMRRFAPVLGKIEAPETPAKYLVWSPSRLNAAHGALAILAVVLPLLEHDRVPLFSVLMIRRASNPGECGSGARP